jgi:glycosyltransferase involved in cell wall biosynthesis
VSHQLKELQARRTGFRADRIAVIHNGVDGGRFFPDAAARARMRRELGLTEDEFCIGAVGNLLPVKDHMTLLKAAHHVGAGSRPWRVVIAGEGSERAALERFLSERPECKQRVCLIGSSDRVPELLNAMDVYVLPSLNEGICNSLLEAMSTGLPVIATATGGTPEVVADGECGLLFPVGDFNALAKYLRQLQAQRDFRIRLGQNAIRRARSEFSIESMVRNYANLYETLGRQPAGVAVTTGAGA